LRMVKCCFTKKHKQKKEKGEREGVKGKFSSGKESFEFAGTKARSGGAANKVRKRKEKEGGVYNCRKTSKESTRRGVSFVRYARGKYGRKSWLGCCSQKNAVNSWKTRGGVEAENGR